MCQEIQRRLSQGWDDRSKSRSKDFALEVCIPTRFQSLRIFVCVKHINRWRIHFGSLPTSTNHVTYRIALGRLCRGPTQECLLLPPLNTNRHSIGRGTALFFTVELRLLSSP